MVAFYAKYLRDISPCLINRQKFIQLTLSAIVIEAHYALYSCTSEQPNPYFMLIQASYHSRQPHIDNKCHCGPGNTWNNHL